MIHILRRMFLRIDLHFSVPEENVAHMKHGATVLKGEMRTAILDGDVQNYDVERGFTRHIIDENGDGGGGIVIKLRQQCILNHIRMLLWDRDLRYFNFWGFLQNCLHE
jgi:BTB/POZ domain-containing protein 9